jgi:thymidylate synthase
MGASANFFKGNCFDDIFWMICKDAWQPDYVTSPRGMKIKEFIAPTIQLTDPRARLCANPHRNANYGFAVGEFLWYWTGKQDLKTMLYYNKRMGNFSDDGFTLNSAYGYRTRVWDIAVGQEETNDGPKAIQTTQWDAVKKTLLEDPDSRRAILIIGQAPDYTVGAFQPSKDLPCTLSLQFFIRDNKLRMHVTMRSNDVFWGLTNDIFSFTLLQEAMMLELRAAGMRELELGDYTHTAGSLHIYEQHFAPAEAAAKSYLAMEFPAARPMEPIDLEGLARLVEYECELREGRVAPDGSARFNGGVRWMAEQLESHRRKRDGERG